MFVIHNVEMEVEGMCLLMLARNVRASLRHSCWIKGLVLGWLIGCSLGFCILVVVCLNCFFVFFWGVIGCFSQEMHCGRWQPMRRNYSFARAKVGPLEDSNLKHLHHEPNLALKSVANKAHTNPINIH